MLSASKSNERGNRERSSGHMALEFGGCVECPGKGPAQRRPNPEPTIHAVKSDSASFILAVTQASSSRSAKGLL